MQSRSVVDLRTTRRPRTPTRKQEKPLSQPGLDYLYLKKEEKSQIVKQEEVQGRKEGSSCKGCRCKVPNPKALAKAPE
jgi:hypothetical protein